MDIAKSAVEGDATIEQDGLSLFLDPQANGMLMNCTIDFNEMQGFGVTGAQPSSSCGTCKC
jgi:Fe-S cluster assembly iron-binding protein IscA